jgi:hypothetical protein
LLATVLNLDATKESFKQRQTPHLGREAGALLGRDELLCWSHLQWAFHAPAVHLLMHVIASHAESKFKKMGQHQGNYKMMNLVKQIESSWLRDQPS